MGGIDRKEGKSDKAPPPIHIAVVNYPGAQRAAIHGLIDLFETATRLASQGQVRLPPIAAREYAAGDCRGRHGSGLCAIILPPSLSGTIPAAVAAPLVPWIRARHRDGCSICSVCAGAFLLAQTGLLDGRKATTHWALAESFAARFPRVSLDADRMLIDHGDLMTAGGVIAWIDLGLRLIERFLTPRVMLDTARMFLVDPAVREQRHYALYHPSLGHGDAAVLRAQQWIARHFAEAVSVPALAAEAGLGERTFLRRFKAATGSTPSAYLQGVRVGRARELLELSGKAFADIAWQLGYEDAGAFRKIFQRSVGIAPGEYRRRFAPGRSQASG